jgi:hypothetical protein
MSAAAATAVRIFLMTSTSIDILVTAPKTDPEDTTFSRIC